MIETASWGYIDWTPGEGLSVAKVFVKEGCETDLMQVGAESFVTVGEGACWAETATDDAAALGCWFREGGVMACPAGMRIRFVAVRDLLLYVSISGQECWMRQQKGGLLEVERFKTLLAEFVASNLKSGVVNIDEAEAIASVERLKGKSIGMCNGCFDLLHLGHAELFLQAKQRCDILFVAINTDESVRELKGDFRPFVNEIGRMGLVSSLRFVDYVVRNDDETCVDVVRVLKPDIYVTSDEYGTSGPEADTVVLMGGKVAVIDRLPGFKTTSIADQIVDAVG